MNMREKEIKIVTSSNEDLILSWLHLHSCARLTMSVILRVGWHRVGGEKVRGVNCYG